MLAAFPLVSCKSAPKAGSHDELDLSIREASNYFNANLKHGSRLAIIAVESGYPDFSEYIIDSLTENLVNDRLFTIVERQQLDAIRAELNFNMSGEVDDNSAQAIGRMLGAQAIIAGSVSAIGDMWRLSLRALSVEKAEVQGIFNRNIPNTAIVAALTSGQRIESATNAGKIQQVPLETVNPGGSTVLPKAASMPANGIYTLMPRPRGRLDGVWQDIFISRIEVDGEYMTVFFEDRETAGSGYGRIGTTFWDKNDVTISDLDKPNVYTRNTGRTGEGGGYIVSVVFPRISSRHFRLENRQGVVFTEVTIGEPDS